MAKLGLVDPHSSDVQPILKTRLDEKGFTTFDGDAEDEEQENVEDVSLPTRDVIYSNAIINSAIPDDLLHTVFKYLDPYSLGCCFRVCKLWNRLAHDESLWAQICEQTYPDCNDDIRQMYGCNWKRMFIERPRLRFDGCYVSKNSYLRKGANEWQVGIGVHEVVFYRVLRFYSTGEVLTTTTVHKTFFQWLNLDKVKRNVVKDKPIYVGTWEFDERAKRVTLNVTQDRYFNTYHLMLNSKKTGKNNRLMLEFAGYGMVEHPLAVNTMVGDMEKKFMFVSTAGLPSAQ
eukprot:GFYU01002830.1.p1 GENE.GFYU01002830.1~~GFYU01002830.1.p1  ORF type:complete len:325 (-),score=74.11 GFYU01002830.1:125-985(-)